MEAKEVGTALAEGVRRLMAAQNPPWNQSDLAEKLGWSTGNVSRMLSVKRAPTSVVISQLATVFNVPLCDLFCDEPPTPKPERKRKDK